MRVKREAPGRFSRCLRFPAKWIILASFFLLPSAADGQSAGDKATARELASEGVRLLGVGQPAEALIKLERAQALYDAPVHLLYIARAHVALGQLVEGAESYRTLVRTKLAPDAPTAFRNAQTDGAKELAEVQPRIGRLTVEIAPEIGDGLNATMDGRPLKSATLGVPRATNPGTHVIVVEAPGYERSEETVEVPEGQASSLRIEMHALPQNGAEEAKATAELAEPRGDSESWDTGSMGFIAGFKLGGVVPFGQLEQDVPMNDYFRIGGGGRLDLGFRFARYLGAKLYLSGAVFRPGRALEAYGEKFQENSESVLLAAQGELGASFLVTSNPRKLGAFGELGLGLLRGYGWVLNYNNDECTSEANYTGWGTRVGGGMNIPLSRLFTLVPALDFSIGQLGRRTTDFGCSDVVSPSPDSTDEELDRALHYQIFFGLGGDFHFGDDWFR